MSPHKVGCVLPSDHEGFCDTRDKRDDLIKGMARLIAGLGVPISLSLPLGTARQAYIDVRETINDFGWSSAEEIETRIRRILDEKEIT